MKKIAAKMVSACVCVTMALCMGVAFADADAEIAMQPPEGVEEVEYIESDGNQYIDTGVKLNSATDEVEIDFELMDYSTGTATGIFGSREGGYVKNYSLHFTTAAKFSMVCDNQGSGTSQHRFVLDGIVGTRYRVYNSRTKRTLTRVADNFMFTPDTQTAEEFVSAENAYLFWGNVETTWLKAKMRLYGCKIFRNGGVLRDFVPCRAVVDGVSTGCLFDRAEQKVYTNQGTRSFTTVPKTLPDGVEELKYIESDGNQYIDMGVKLDSGTDEVEIEFAMTGYSTTTASAIFGSRVGSSQENYTLQFTSAHNILFGCRADSSDTAHQLRWDGAVRQRYVIRTSQSSRTLTDAATSRELASDTMSLVSFSSTENAYLFWANVEASWLKAQMRLYSCKILRNGGVLRDFVPCRAVVDGVSTVCLYDRVTRDFYTNKGTGSFTAPVTHGKIRIVQICDPQFGFTTGNIPDRTAENHEKYYAADLDSFKKMIPHVNAEGADLVVIAGDLVQYSDELTRDWPELLKQFTAPVLVVPGNHDLGKWSQDHTTYTSSTAYEQSYKDFVSVVGYGYGSRTIGNWRIVGMNSQFWQSLDGSDYMESQKSAHQDWYDGEIAAAKSNGQGLIVVSHVPPFETSVGDADSMFNFPMSVRTTLMDQVLDAGGTAWLAGHAHLHRVNAYGDLKIYIGEAMCANYANGGWPRGYTVLEVAAGSCEATWRDVTESEWRAAADDLLLHYRADTGVTTNDAGKVTAWKNLGTLGAAGDVVEVVDKDNAICPSDITLSAAGANGKPSVVFAGSSCLKTSGDIDFDTDSSRGACWFVALKSCIDYSKSANGCVMGLVDNVTTTKRFGAFHPEADVNKKHFIVYAFQDGASGSVQVKDCPDGWFVMSHSAWGSSNSSGYNGTYASFGKGLDGPAVGPFFAGKFGTLTWPIFVGEIAEIRCYSRALTPSERTAVQMEMGINAGVEPDVAENMDMELFQADNRAYCHDGIALGYAMSGPGGVTASGLCGGLKATLEGAIRTDEKTTCYLAHNNASGSRRVWCLAAIQSATEMGRAHAMKLTYSDAAKGGVYTLCYRSETTGAWTEIGPFVREKQSDAPSIVLPAGWKDGYYCVKQKKGLVVLIF